MFSSKLASHSSPIARRALKTASRQPDPLAKTDRRNPIAAARTLRPIDAKLAGIATPGDETVAGGVSRPTD